ncbi:MAG TPA: DUF6306 domain-containing protein [Pseudomonadales bacterium]
MNEDDFRDYASPPCFQHELEGAGFAGMDREYVLTRLDTLLEGERAGARGLRDTRADFGDGPLGELLAEVGRDEARFCAMLTRHIERLGGTPSRATGVFYEKLLSRPDPQARLRLLDRGQKAVVDMLDDLLGRTLDMELRRDLEEMREVHVQNIARCAAYLADDR